MKYIYVLFALMIMSFGAMAQQNSVASISWDAPTTRVDGQPLSLDEIQNYNLYCGDVTTTIPPSTETGTYEVSRSEILPGYGEHTCYMTTVDVNGLESEPSERVTIAWEITAPSSPTNLIIILE